MFKKLKSDVAVPAQWRRIATGTKFRRSNACNQRARYNSAHYLKRYKPLGLALNLIKWLAPQARLGPPASSQVMST